MDDRLSRFDGAKGVVTASVMKRPSQSRKLIFRIVGEGLCLLAATAARGAEKEGVTIPLKPYIAGLCLAEMKVEGKIGQFIFDSAGGLSLITPEFARVIGLEPFGRLTAFKHTGERIQFRRSLARHLSIGGVKMQATELAVFDLMKLLKGALWCRVWWR